MYKIGIDIGGTHTDAVCINSKNEICYVHKVESTSNINVGLKVALKELIEYNHIDKTKIKSINIGATTGLNALLQNSGLQKVGILRLAGHNPDMSPPLYKWPAALKNSLFAASININGGQNCHGKSISELNYLEVLDALKKLQDSGAQGIAVVGCFSPLYPFEELQVADIIKQHFKDLFFSLSHQVGGIGFIERENACVLNTALYRCMQQGWNQIREIITELNLNSSIFLTDNTGSLISLEEALAFPIKTLCAGASNSFIGAARLSGLENVIVADVGGTSTDVGLILGGLINRNLQGTTIAGVNINADMPSLISIPLGGGSIIEFKNNNYTLGPSSVGSKLREKSYTFGGSTWTLTDMAVSEGRMKNIDSYKIPALPAGLAADILKEALHRIQKTAQRLCLGKKIPLIMVGGGAALWDEEFVGSLKPSNVKVANAYGAALALVSATIDRVVSLEQRSKVLESLREEAKLQALAKGAEVETLHIHNEIIMPYPYAPQALCRVVILAAGAQSFF